VTYRLLDSDEPSAVLEQRPDGCSPFVIAVDHAGLRIPKRLGTLGLPPSELERHTAWDIGALEVAKRISAALDAPLVAQEYSRLVIDCNRTPGSETSIPTMAEWLTVPGNIDLSEEDTAARRTEIFEPYHDSLQALLDIRQKETRLTILLALHTMTNVYKGVPREMHAAVLYGRDDLFARVFLDVLREDGELVIAENVPYRVLHGVHYTIPHHAELRGLPHVEVEIRQDLVSESQGQKAWAQRICRALLAAERKFFQRQ